MVALREHGAGGAAGSGSVPHAFQGSSARGASSDPGTLPRKSGLDPFQATDDILGQKKDGAFALVFVQIISGERPWVSPSTQRKLNSKCRSSSCTKQESSKSLEKLILLCFHSFCSFPLVIASSFVGFLLFLHRLVFLGSAVFLAYVEWMISSKDTPSVFDRNANG